MTGKDVRKRGEGGGGKNPSHSPSPTSSSANGQQQSSTSTATKRVRPPSKSSKSGSGSNAMTQILLKIVSLLILPVLFGYFGYQMHQTYIILPGIVNTPSDLPRILEEDAFSPTRDPARYWGTYRSNMYFGMRTRDPRSPMIGLMWFRQPGMQQGQIGMPQIRHWCDQGDQGIRTYGWVEHDGLNFGREIIQEESQQIEISFVKQSGGVNGGDWTARVTAQAHEAESKPISSFIVYITLPEGDVTDGSFIKPVIEGDNTMQHISQIKGFTPQLGHFRLRIHQRKAANIVAKGFLATHIPKIPFLSNLKEVMISGMGVMETPNKHLKHFVGLMGYTPVNQPKTSTPNILALQLTYLTGTDFDIVFESASHDTERKLELTGDAYDALITQHSEAFQKKFEERFGLAQKQYPKAYVDVGQLALSNMLGSIGYFYGSSLVQSPYNPTPVEPFFPRGFLWDDGFHHILLRKWDLGLSMQILGSWLDLMNIDGWIPREMILGKEAESKVPAEYIVQKSAVANPPVYFYLINLLLNEDKAGEHKDQLVKMYPRLEKWYNWLNASQSGEQIGTYRWRGRNETTNLELNPKTMASGFDDYPRASHPSPAEYHVDLYVWMTMSSEVLRRLAILAGKEGSEMEQKLTETASYLKDLKHLDDLHWSDKIGRYADFGLHTKNVKLEKPKPVMGKDGQMRMPPNSQMTRAVKREPSLRLVSDTLGYVSLFPLFLRMLPPDSTKLPIILKQLRDEEGLWSRFGLRSLSKTSPMYNTRNTEHDPPYWRGAVWMNMNYLALSALHHYSQVKGPHRDLAYNIYGELRGNVVSNVVREYMKTGYLWEHYDDENGQGAGTHPFTGWTSLILLMMSEEY